MKPLLTLAAALLVAIAGMTGARAQSEPPQEAPVIGEDPALEKRVNEIGLELRCLVTTHPKHGQVIELEWRDNG